MLALILIMDIETTKYLVFGTSILTGIVIFATSYNLRKSRYFKIISIIALALTCLGLILERLNSFELPSGLTIVVMSISTIYLLYFEMLNRLFFKINGYYPWIPNYDFFAYLSKRRPDKFINKPQPKNYSTTSNWFYTILLNAGWIFTIIVLLMLIIMNSQN